MAKLFIYNPTCDMAVENGTYSYMPSRQLAQFEADISPLMAFLGRNNDYLLYEGDDEAFAIFWKRLGIHLPCFINKSTLQQAAITDLFPWGWSPVIHQHYASSLGLSSLNILKSPSQLRRFFSRETSVELIKELNKHRLPAFVTIPSLPLTIRSTSSAEECLNKYPNGMVIKTLWSSSGRGLQFIRNTHELSKSQNWLEAQLRKQGAVVAEPIYHKVQDASLQFMIQPDGTIDFLGLNFFDADQQGHFSKEYFHTPESVADKLPLNNNWLKDLADLISTSMQTLGIPQKYQGPVGIDAMFITDHQQQLKFYPLVEANLRCNMGLVNMAIKKLLHPTTKGTWKISQFQPGEAPRFLMEKTLAHPVKTQEQKIIEGWFPLTPFTADTRFAAWGQID
ncbi:hypothetical protein [Carboxylicivirga taeanensis]|uniref:hypothetical protein n=1 Tax=Carboxylicivirga taeanensis TaxID=1416875 RepID=UPI003F6DE30F